MSSGSYQYVTPEYNEVGNFEGGYLRFVTHAP